MAAKQRSYLITFSLNTGKNLIDRYSSVVRAIDNLVSNDSENIVRFHKTAFLIKSEKDKNEIRDELTRVIRTEQSGRVLVIDITLTGWSIFVEGTSEERQVISWMKKNT